MIGAPHRNGSNFVLEFERAGGGKAMLKPQGCVRRNKGLVSKVCRKIKARMDTDEGPF